MSDSGSDFERVMPGRMAYRVHINSLDVQWRWTCPDCGRRYYEKERSAINMAVRLHRCSSELTTRWLIASRHRYRHK